MTPVFTTKSAFERYKQDQEKLKKKAKAPLVSDNPKTPESNKKAKKVASEKTEEAKKKAKKLSESVKQREKDKPVDFKIQIFGKEITRRTQDGKVIYLDTNGKRIADLGKWAKEQLKNKSLKEKVEKDLKPYSSKLEAVTAAQKAKALRDLNKKSIFQLQNGADSGGNIKGDRIELAAIRAKALLEKKSVVSFKVSDNLASLNNKQYLDYQHVLPPNATTIILNRNGKKIVCVRMIDRSAGGRIGYFNLEDGKRIQMKVGDTVDIIGTLDTRSKKYKDLLRNENAQIKTRIKAGAVYNKNKEKPVKIIDKKQKKTSSAAYTPSTTTGQSAAGIKSQEPAPQTEPESKPAKSKEKWDPANNESKEVGGEYNIKTVRNPEINDGRNVHLFIPEKLDPKKPTHIVYYFHGFGKPSDKAKELLTNPDDWSKKHALSGLKDLAKTHNIVFAMPEGESEKSKWWSLQKKTNFRKFDEFVRKESGADKTKSIKRYLLGHSGAYIAMNGILGNIDANFFDGMGLFDTLYGKETKTARQFYRRLSKHDKMKIWSVYRENQQDPNRHNKKLQQLLQKKPGSRKQKQDISFKTSDLSHSNIKAPAIRDSVKFFVKKEKA